MKENKKRLNKKCLVQVPFSAINDNISGHQVSLLKELESITLHKIYSKNNSPVYNNEVNYFPLSYKNLILNIKSEIRQRSLNQNLDLPEMEFSAKRHLEFLSHFFKQELKIEVNDLNSFNKLIEKTEFSNLSTPLLFLNSLENDECQNIGINLTDKDLSKLRNNIFEKHIKNQIPQRFELDFDGILKLNDISEKVLSIPTNNKSEEKRNSQVAAFVPYVDEDEQFFYLNQVFNGDMDRFIPNKKKVYIIGSGSFNHDFFHSWKLYNYSIIDCLRKETRNCDFDYSDLSIKHTENGPQLFANDEHVELAVFDNIPINKITNPTYKALFEMNNSAWSNSFSWPLENFPHNREYDRIIFDQFILRGKTWVIPTDDFIKGKLDSYKTLPRRAHLKVFGNFITVDLSNRDRSVAIVKDILKYAGKEISHLIFEEVFEDSDMTPLLKLNNKPIPSLLYISLHQD